MSRPTPFFFLCATLALSHTVVRAADVKSIDSDNTTGMARAVVVDDVPLAHTAQFLPVDERGQIVGKGQAGTQINKVLDNLATALAEVRSGLGQVVKLNVYATRSEVVAEVKKALAGRFRGETKPAVSFVTGTLSHPDALVAADAVALTPVDPGGQVKRLRSPKLPGNGHVAILPAGSRVYVAGQAGKGNLAEATRRTLDSLHKTLQALGVKDADIVQMKAFLHPMSAAGEVEKEVARFFDDGNPAPLVLVEWISSLPIEIELIAWAGPRNTKATDVIEYLTPPGMSASPIFSRVARINRGKTIYVSGLYGNEKGSAETEIKDIFATLGSLLDKTGSDFRHLAKATYYVATDDSSRKLNELRPRYYDPRRPPSASKAQVAGTGVAGTSLTLDMIAVPSPLRAEGKPEYGHGLTAEEAPAGWISLFDGATPFGWTGAKVADGRLTGSTTTTEFGNCELRAELAAGGTITIGGKEIKVGAGKFALGETGRRGPIQLGPGVAVRTLHLRPLGLKPLFNGKDLTGWKRIDRPTLPENRRPVWKVTDGLLEAVGGPGALEYQEQQFGDLVAQVEVRTRARHANGGFFFRSVPGQFMNGYEAQLYNCCEDGDPAKTSKWSTGALDDRQSARRLVSRDYEFFTMTVIAHGPHIATWVNGHQLTDWTDQRPKHENPRQGLRVEPGTIQLQAHDPATDLAFRSIQAAGMK